MKVLHCVAVVAVAVCVMGCESQNASGPVANSGQSASAYLGGERTSGALPVGEARAKSEDGQEVTLVGRIGGSTKPFVDGLAAFTIVDAKVPYCGKDEGCRNTVGLLLPDRRGEREHRYDQVG